jgi:Ca2+-binding RTX toxin-like protein
VGALAVASEADMPINFRKLFYLGDSITDDGRLPEPFRPDPPYEDGRFTNGLVYAQVLTQELGIPSNNFAYGGAKALSSEPQQFLIGLNAQVTEFEIRNPFGAPSDSAAVIFIGGNDYHDADPNDPTIVGRVLESIDDAAGRLARRGVDELILFNLPLSLLTPRGIALPEAERAAEDAMITAHNAGLLQLAATYNSAGVPTTIVDVDRLTREVRSDLETFGLKVFDIPLYTLDQNDRPVPTGIMADPDEVAYFDPVHPSAAGHGILAAFAEATLRADRIVFGENGGDVVSGVSGADFVVAGGGNDSVLAADGNDVILAGQDNDTVDGGAGSDLVIGGSGRDVLNGSVGSDLLAGNAGDDTIEGGDDNDIILPGSGHDLVYGRPGDDLLILTADALSFDPVHDQVYGGIGLDTLRLEVSDTVFASPLSQSEIQAFVPDGVTILNSIGLTAQRVERLEVYVDGTLEFAAGLAGPNQGADAAAQLRNADLWGVV